MGNENEHPMTGSGGSGASGSAEIKNPAGFATRDVGIQPPEDQAISEDTFDSRLKEALACVIERLDTLTAAVTGLVKNGSPSGAVSSDGGGAGLGTEREAMVFAAFCLSAVKRGMSPDMVADAFRLADLSGISADGEIPEVTGVEEAVDTLLLTKPYLFSARPANVGSETNPLTGPASYSEDALHLARALGVSPRFAAEIVKKRSDRAGGVQDFSGLWRVPRVGRLSALETNE